jgi:hypothetical protein
MEQRILGKVGLYTIVLHVHVDQNLCLNIYNFLLQFLYSYFAKINQVRKMFLENQYIYHKIINFCSVCVYKFIDAEELIRCHIFAYFMQEGSNYMCKNSVIYLQ